MLTDSGDPGIPFGTWQLVAAALSCALQSPVPSVRHWQAQYSHGVHLEHHALHNIAPMHT